MEVKLTRTDFIEFLRDQVLTPDGDMNWDIPGGQFDKTLYSHDQKKICHQLAWCLRISKVAKIQDNVSVNDERIKDPNVDSRFT